MEEDLDLRLRLYGLRSSLLDLWLQLSAVCEKIFDVADPILIRLKFWLTNDRIILNLLVSRLALVTFFSPLIDKFSNFLPSLQSIIFETISELLGLPKGVLHLLPFQGLLEGFLSVNLLEPIDVILAPSLLNQLRA